MVIREAVEADIPAIVALGEAMFPLSVFAGFVSYDPVSVAQTVAALLASDEGCVLVAEDQETLLGMLCAMIVPLYLNTAVRVLSELAWFVAPGKRQLGIGAQLASAMEAWGRAHESTLCMMSALASHARIESWYLDQGYMLHEHSYVKAL